MPRYVVPIHYIGLNIYIVDASSPEEAEAEARVRYYDGDKSDDTRGEWEEIDRIGEVRAMLVSDGHKLTEGN
jgi:hypothetical protein